MRGNPEHVETMKQHGIEPIDMVVVNLYPFEKTVADPNCTFEQAIEMIDIGGPTLLRAAAKNHRHVIVLADRFTYTRTLMRLRGEAEWDDDFTLWLVSRAFDDTASYDDFIHKWFAEDCWKGTFPPAMHLNLRMTNPRILDELKYGENPHQQAAIFIEKEYYADSPIWSGFNNAEEDRHEKISFNNYNDASAGIAICSELVREIKETSACVFIKHTNPCGVALSRQPLDAYRNAYSGDVNAAMGGILVCSFPITAEIAEVVMHTYERFGKSAGAGGFFVEVWAAPSFDQEAESFIRSDKPWGKRLHLLDVEDALVKKPASHLVYRSVQAGILVQTPDLVGVNEDQWKVVTKRKPTESEISDLRLAWLIAKHTKSNAISICKDGMLIGNGAGQMSRVMSCRIATWLANENGHAEKLKGSVAASDAFFPFPDGPNILMDAGVTAIIQPGGSKNDEKTTAACDARNVAMIFTGTRHFKH